MKKFLVVVGVIILILVVLLWKNGELTSLSGQLIQSPQTMNALQNGKDLPSTQADLGIVIKANQRNHFACGGREGVQFTLLGPNLNTDSDTQITIMEFDWKNQFPNGNMFYSTAKRQAVSSLPPNTLTTFTRGKEYDVETTKDLFMQCGRNLDTMYKCGNGIVEGTQAIPSIGFVHEQEECDGGTGCSKDCKSL